MVLLKLYYSLYRVLHLNIAASTLVVKGSLQSAKRRNIYLPAGRYIASVQRTVFDTGLL